MKFVLLMFLSYSLAIRWEEVTSLFKIFSHVVLLSFDIDTNKEILTK